MSGARASRRTALLVIGVAAACGIAIGLGLHALRGGSSGPTADGKRANAIQGQAIWPVGQRRAPEFSLRDSEGQRFSLSSLRGRPAIVTFFDSQCHQECPLEGRALAAAFRAVPAAARPVVVAVSVNPWEDTPGSARRAMKRFGLGGYEWRWLLGSRAELARVWNKYRIEVRRTKGDVEHTDALYLIDRRGYERAGMVYPFLPNWVSRDLETLAAED